MIPGFGFERPILAVSVILIIPLAFAIARRLGSPFTASVPLGPPGGVSFKAPFSLEGIVKALRVLECIAVLALFFGAAGPYIKTSETVWITRGADIMFILDISPSMAALDMDGASRFSAARRLLLDFAEKRPSDGIGLVAVGNDAALLIPPSTDRQALADRLESLQIGELGDGTALGMGLAVAAYHLDRSAAPRRAAVLITDGENNAGAIHPETAAAMLADTGASLWVIGVGSGGEVPIDYVDPVTRTRRTGIYDSRFDTDSLRQISAAGNGNWILAPSAQAFASVFSRLDSEEMVIRRFGAVTNSRPIHVPFLLASLGIFTLSRFIKRFFLGAWL